MGRVSGTRPPRRLSESDSGVIDPLLLAYGWKMSRHMNQVRQQFLLAVTAGCETGNRGT